MKYFEEQTDRFNMNKEFIHSTLTDSIIPISSGLFTGKMGICFYLFHAGQADNFPFMSANIQKMINRISLIDGKKYRIIVFIQKTGWCFIGWESTVKLEGIRSM
jgi:hypothetical protein